MKLFSIEVGNAAAAAVLHPTDASLFQTVSQLAKDLPTTMEELLAAGPEAMDRLQKALKASASSLDGWLQLGSAVLLPPVPRPGKIICVGLNYADHAKEGGNARPDYPSFFFRGATSLIAANEHMTLPPVSDKLDYEAELAIVIGRPTRYATLENALQAVAGYACFNDGTLRDYQRKTAQWTIGKNFDGTGAFGPWIVTPDEVPVGASGLSIVSRLNGKVMQSADTVDMLWGVAELIVLLSECLTLEPGDVIATGTPSGVGYARTPPVFMREGDMVEVEIKGLGCLRNVIKAEQSDTKAAA